MACQPRKEYLLPVNGAFCSSSVLAFCRIKPSLRPSPLGHFVASSPPLVGRLLCSLPPRGRWHAHLAQARWCDGRSLRHFEILLLTTRLALLQTLFPCCAGSLSQSTTDSSLPEGAFSHNILRFSFVYILLIGNSLSSATPLWRGFRYTIKIPPHSGGYFSFGHSPNITGGAQVR